MTNKSILAGILFLSSAVLLSSCSSSDNNIDDTTSKVQTVTITSAVANSRVAYTYNAGLVPTWETSDKLTVYRGIIASANKSTDFTPNGNITSGASETTSASFTGSLKGSGTTLNAFVQATGLTFNETDGTATVNLSSQIGTITDVKNYNLLFASVSNYADNAKVSMAFNYKMAVLRLDLTIPTTANISSLKLHASSGLCSSVVFNSDGTVKSSAAGDISLTGLTWTTSGTNQSTTVYAVVCQGQLNDLYAYATDANNIVYSAKIGSKAVEAGTLYTLPTKNLATFVGSGTSSSPYQVSGEATLRLLSYVSGSDDSNIKNKYNTSSITYQQIEDISLSGKIWEPISYFSGTYDGNSKAIIGTMDMSNSTSTALGLFGKQTNATIKGVNMNATIKLPSTQSSLRSYFGTIVGEAINCTISDCNNLSAVNGNADYMGGIVGYLNGKTKILHCTNTGALTTSSNYSKASGTGLTDTSCDGPCVGGIVGNVTNGNDTNTLAIIEACSNSGALTCSSTNTYASAGGLVGYLNTAKVSYNMIRGCYSTASSVMGYYAGGLIGCTSAKTQTMPTAAADNSIVSACWSSTAPSSMTATKGGTVAGYSIYCSYYYCVLYSSSYLGSGSNNSTNTCNTYSSTSSGKLLVDWTTNNNTNLNTVWNSVTGSLNAYKFVVSGSGNTATLTITNK